MLPCAKTSALLSPFPELSFFLAVDEILDSSQRGVVRAHKLRKISNLPSSLELWEHWQVRDSPPSPGDILVLQSCACSSCTPCSAVSLCFLTNPLTPRALEGSSCAWHWPRSLQQLSPHLGPAARCAWQTEHSPMLNLKSSSKLSHIHEGKVHLSSAIIICLLRSLSHWEISIKHHFHQIGNLGNHKILFIDMSFSDQCSMCLLL